MGRLRTVNKDGSLLEEYQYDSVGRRTYEMSALKGISGRTFTYSNEDHLLTTGDANYKYDSDGFLTTKTQGTDVTTYHYSLGGELITVNLPDGSLIEYINDPVGRRIAKKVDGTIVEKYLWQGLTRLLAVYDGSNNLIMRFEYADARMPMAMTKGGVTYYLTYDQVGSLRVVADASGNVIKRIDCDSFGSIINDTNTGFTIPFGLAGGLHDRDTGLVRFGFRDYDPEIGRWTAKDPILFDGGDVDLYGYVQNNPISFRDSSGLAAFFWHGIISLTAGLAEGRGWGQSSQMAWDSMWRDKGTQGPLSSDTNIHGMIGLDPLTGNKQFPGEAIMKAKEIVAAEAKCGRHGNAMHTVQDLEFFWHAGQEWKGNNPLENPLAIPHWILDVTPPVMQLWNAFQASRQYLHQQGR
jgi:RHS repeat-associated protein